MNRHASRSARRRASMSSGSTSPVTRRRATRSSAASSGSTKATRSTRSRSSAARTASRASASSRTSWRSSRPRARRPIASCSASNVEEKPTGQLSLSGGYSSLEQFVIQLAVSQNNFMGKGQSLDASINYSRLFEIGRGSASPTLTSSTSRSCSADSSSAATTTASTSSATSATRPTARSAPAAASRVGFPLTEFGASAPAIAGPGQVTLDKSTFYTDPDGTGPLRRGLRSAQGRPLSVRRNRHAD